MAGNEWPLIVFTLLVQTGVGLYLSIVFYSCLLKEKRKNKNLNMMDQPKLLTIVSLTGVGILAAFFHLGDPRKAVYSLNSLGTSWLSREILFLILFFVLIKVQIFLKWKINGKGLFDKCLTILIFINGVVLILCMAMLYKLPTVPEWNNLITPISFFITSLFLGGLVLAVFINLQIRIKRKRNSGSDIPSSFITSQLQQRIGTITLILLALEVLVFFLYLDRTGLWRTLSAAETPGSSGLFQILFLLRLIFLLATAALLITILKKYQKENHLGVTKDSLVYVAFLFALMSEIIGRYLFYTLVRGTGM